VSLVAGLRTRPISSSSSSSSSLSFFFSLYILSQSLSGTLKSFGSHSFPCDSSLWVGVIFGEHKEGPVRMSDQGSFSLEFGVHVGKLHCTCGGCCLFVCLFVCFNKLISLQKSMQEKRCLRLCVDLGFGSFFWFFFVLFFLFFGGLYSPECSVSFFFLDTPPSVITSSWTLFSFEFSTENCNY